MVITSIKHYWKQPRIRLGGRMKSIWDDEAVVELLVKLWNEGHSLQEIGRIMGITRNSALSKVRRMRLPPRCDPVKRNSPKTKVSLDMPKREILPLAIRTAPVRNVISVSKYGRFPNCQFIEGHPRYGDYLFCAKPTFNNTPYCETHFNVCYIR